MVVGEKPHTLMGRIIFYRYYVKLLPHMYMQGSCSGINSSALIRIDAPVATELIELMLQAWPSQPI